MAMNRVQRLALSPADFRHFLITTGRVSEHDLRVNPARICELMSRDDLWEQYEQMAELRASVCESGLLQNGGNKNERKEWHYVE